MKTTKNKQQQKIINTISIIIGVETMDSKKLIKIILIVILIGIVYTLFNPHFN